MRKNEKKQQKRGRNESKSERSEKDRILNKRRKREIEKGRERWGVKFINIVYQKKSEMRGRERRFGFTNGESEWENGGHKKSVKVRCK